MVRQISSARQLEYESWLMWARVKSLRQTSWISLACGATTPSRVSRSEANHALQYSDRFPDWETGSVVCVRLSKEPVGQSSPQRLALGLPSSCILHMQPCLLGPVLTDLSWVHVPRYSVPGERSNSGLLICCRQASSGQSRTCLTLGLVKHSSVIDRYNAGCFSPD